MEVWGHKTSLTPPQLIVVPEPASHEGDRSCICVLCISNLLISTVFLLDFGTVSLGWLFFIFLFIVGQFYWWRKCEYLEENFIVTGDNGIQKFRDRPFYFFYLGGGGGIGVGACASKFQIIFFMRYIIQIF